MTPRRKELEEQIKELIAQGVKGDHALAKTLHFSHRYIQSIRLAAGIKYPHRLKNANYDW